MKVIGYEVGSVHTSSPSLFMEEDRERDMINIPRERERGV